MDINELINEDLIHLDINVKSDQAAIKILGETLCRHGYSNEKYMESVAEREKQFPTGIALLGSGIAIPHATPEENVMKNGIAILRTKEPVLFHSMESADDLVLVQLVFLLALKDSQQHLAMLQKLFGMFQQNDLMEILQKTTNKEKIKEQIISNLK